MLSNEENERLSNERGLDKVSRDYWVNRLNSKGYQATPTDELCHWDVDAVSGDTRLILEVKHRTFDSTKYGDNMVRLQKVSDLSDEISKNGEDGYIISMFTDGVAFINKVGDEYTVRSHYVPHTTFFSNKEMMYDDYAHFKPRWVTIFTL